MIIVGVLMIEERYLYCQIYEHHLHNNNILYIFLLTWYCKEKNNSLLGRFFIFFLTSEVIRGQQKLLEKVDKNIYLNSYTDFHAKILILNFFNTSVYTLIYK